MKKGKKGLSTFQLIIFGFAALVLVGAVILTLPISSKAGTWTPFSEALFTSTSAVCVTGLIVQDTATYWSVFGKIIIITMIQIGGLGVITIAAMMTIISGKKISLMQRSTMQEALSAPEVGGIVRLTLFVLKWTGIFELSGALLLMPVFCKEYGVKGIFYSFFHSVSAFCNAGFDILGTPDNKFQSMTRFSGNILLNVVVMLLIIIGGIGFLTWEDVKKNKLHFKRYKMQSKVILVTSGLLIFLPALLFFFADFADLPIKERILASLFQSVTMRTAGFNTVDLSAMSGGSKGVCILLMLVGGSPGSTAGGMKTTTLALLLINAVAVFRKKDDTEVFGRRIDPNVIRTAATIVTMYVTLFLSGAVAISFIEKIPFETCIYETASAVGTVGITLGITPSLGVASRLILILLMFFGRVGGLTLIYAAFSKQGVNVSRKPLEKLTVG